MDATTGAAAAAVGHDDDGSSVRVAVRVRPLIGREKVERCDECVSVVEDEMQIVMGKNRSFTYDYVFSKYAQQSDIWTCVEPLVQAAFDGYNATIFAYGQTGSGKTFTMGSGSSVHIPPEEYGIVPRVIGFIFDQISGKQLAKPQYQAEVRIRFLEIYGEEIRDLLVNFVSDSTGESRVTLRETEKGEVLVTGATEELVDDADLCLRLLERGTLARTTGSTLMNAHSSRSHAIFTVSLVQRIPLDGVEGQGLGDDEYETRTSHFNFVDLAGSERQKRTQAEGKRLKEGIDINKGLLALGNVISALGDDSKRGRVHVPYRDSKLTRMLQDSLGGNSRTLMLCCVSPADVNFEETLNALKYANRARNIKNKPVVNRDEGSALTAELRRQVQILQAEVFRLRNPGISESELKMANIGLNIVGMPMDADTYTSLRSRAETAENEVARLTSELKRNRSQLDHLRDEMITAQAERDMFKIRVEDTSAGGAHATPAQREKTADVLTKHLRTISELQDKLREAERERDRAVMNPFSGGASTTFASKTSSTMMIPTLEEPELKVDTDLLARAEKDIERESQLLEKLQSDTTMDGDVGDLTGGDGERAGEDEEMEESTGELSLNLELTEEDADRERVFQRRLRHLGESMQDLAHDISLKEQLVDKIRDAQVNFDRLKSFYEQKMALMADQVRNIQLDRDRLIEEIQQVENKIRTSGDQGAAGSGRLAKLANDLKEKDNELIELKKKQNEMNRFMAQKKKNEMQLRVLTAEISGMKRQKVELMKKMQDERKRYEEEANRRHREILSLKKAQQRDKQRIQQLGSQKEAQERVLKRKMEEINATKARLKQQQQLQAQARRTQTATARNRMSNMRDNETKWLSDEVKRRAEEQRKLEQLKQERESVMKEMEKLYAERDKLEADLRCTMSTSTNIRDVLISPMKAPPLVRRHSRAASNERQLAPEEEQLLFDLEERIEACQAQLEYKEDKISEIAEDGVALVKIDNTQSLPEARSLLKMLFSMAVDVKKQDQLKEQEVSKMQVEVNEMAKRLEQERDRAQQLKQSYEEALQKVMASGEPEAPASVGTPLNERTRILLSVSEERNAALRQKCDELENIQEQRDRERQALSHRVAQDQQELHASREHIRWLEAQLERAGAVHSNQGGESAVGSSTHAPSSPSSSYSRQPSGPVSWANEFDDEDDDDDDDEDMRDDSHQEEDYDMENAPSRRRHNFRMQLDHMGDNLDSITLTTERVQRAYASQRSGSTEPYRDDHEDGKDESAPSSSGSIFSRLSNPSNFTGIHKNRARESVTKREVLQHRSDKVRSRRLKDRSIAKPARATTPTEQRMASVSKFAVKPQAKRSSVLEVLENMKLQKDTAESHHRPRSPAPRPSSSLSDANDGPISTTSSSSIPPPAPYSDVYSRLAAQYTQSAQSKRQRSAPTSRRTPGSTRGDDGSNNDGVGGNSSVDGHSQDEANAESDYLSEDYDPLLGTSSSNLVARVHDDYRERLSGRSTSMPKLATSSTSSSSTPGGSSRF